MKIALLTDYYLPRQGGLELHVRDLAEALTLSGCEVHLVTPTRTALADQGWRLPAFALPDPPGVVVHRLAVPLAPRYKFACTPAVLGATRRLLERERFDLVHAMVGIVTPAALVGTWVATRLALPTVVTFHSALYGHRHVLRAFDVLAGWSRWPLVFTAVSEVVAAEVGQLTRGRPVHVLPNGVHPDRWRCERVPGEPGELRLISVMRLNGRKRGTALLRAFSRARGEVAGRVRLRLTVVGDGPQGPRLRRLASSLSLDGSVAFLGHLDRERVRNELARADAFVLASVLESFGVAALEARAAGLPVVARDSGGVKEFVGHEREGLLAGSDAELSRALVRLATEPGLLERLSALVRGSPVPLSWAESVERHLHVYRAALRGEEPATPAPRGEASRSGAVVATPAASPCG